MKLKERLISVFGIAGMILFYVISYIVYILPLVMIDKPFWLNILFFAILYFFPVSSIVFWIWGLVCAINGQQDFWAIIYYVLLVVMWIPFFISTVKELFLRKHKNVDQQ